MSWGTKFFIFRLNQEKYNFVILVPIARGLADEKKIQMRIFLFISNFIQFNSYSQRAVSENAGLFLG